VTAIRATSPLDLWRATPRRDRLPRAIVLAAIGVLGLVLMKVVEGPGIHPTIHRLVTTWGIGLFSLLAIGSAIWQARALRRLPPAGDAARFWWAWASAALAVGATGWLLIQLVNADIGEPVCVNLGSDYGVCNPNRVRVWATAGLAVGVGFIGMAVAVRGVVALAAQRAPIGTLIGPPMVFAGVAAAGLPIFLTMYALATSHPPVVIETWTVFGVCIALALASELLAIWWLVRRARS
jgi:hypothetical protein